MKHYYGEILEAMGEPRWWDKNFVPRYGAFNPEERTMVYNGKEVALVDIRCQSCGEVFHVCASAGNHSPVSLEESIRENKLQFGDPPNNNCCAVGPTMSSVPIRVLEFWRSEPRKDNPFRNEWVRVSELERDIRINWFKEYYARFLSEEKMNPLDQDYSLDWKSFLRDELEVSITADDPEGTEFSGNFGKVNIRAYENNESSALVLVDIEVAEQNRGAGLGKIVMEALRKYIDRRKTVLEVREVVNLNFISKFSWLTEKESSHSEKETSGRTYFYISDFADTLEIPEQKERR